MKAPRTRLVLAKSDKAAGKRASPPPLKLVPDAPARMPAVLEFQPDASELEEQTPPRLARLTLYAVVLFLACGVLWASLAEMDEVVVAPGKLLTSQPMLVVQPLETSVIRTVAVKVGDTVHKGQVLAKLDPTFVTADVKQLREKIHGFDAQIERIGAELDGVQYAAPPEARPDERLQARLFAQRRAFRQAKLRDFETQIAQGQATLAAAQEDETVLIKRLDGLHEIDRMRQTLFDKGAGSRLTYLQGRDVSLDTEASLARLRGSQVETVQTLEQTRAERQAFIEDFRRQAMENLVQLRDDRAAAAEELKKAVLRQQMAVLTAPADASVLDIAQRSIGSVVREAEPLFTLVPLHVPLEAEVSVAASDIGRLAGEDQARIKLDAFPFQKHGTVEGRIRMISRDSFAPDERSQAPAPFYKVRLALGDTATLRNLPQDFHLIPGMTVQSEIKVGTRSVISYFLYPLLRGLDESLHEP